MVGVTVVAVTVVGVTVVGLTVVWPCIARVLYSSVFALLDVWFGL